MRILFYGDSNTWGYNAQTGMRYEKRFPALIRQAFPEDEIIEEGLCGRTLCHSDPYSLEERNGAKTVSMLLKTHVPLDLVVIMLGTNDAKRVYGTNALTSLEKGMDLLLHQVLDRDNYKHCLQVPKVLVVCPPKMHLQYQQCPHTFIHFGQEGFDMLEQAARPLQTVCEKWKVDFLDPQNIRAGELDALHLDEKGHQELACKLIEKLGEYR